jgi:YD repeat-containing protein
MIKEDVRHSSSKFHRFTVNTVLIFFLFNTFFPVIPSITPEANAQQNEVTYITNYSYDNNNNVTSRITPNGHTIQYTYDKLNRLTKKTFPDLSEVSYGYDANGNRTSMTDSQGTTNYVYDRFNRLREVWPPGINPIYYDYDKSNNLTKITYPSGETVTYTYDTSNRLWKVTDNTGITTYEYDNLTNNLIKQTLPNGVITEYTYDLARRITDVVNKKSDGTLISSYHYTFDANNNRIQVIETTSSGTKTVSYIYDKLNRLTSAIYSDGTYEMYTYDSSGNRLTKTTQDGTINYEYDGDNRLIKAGSSTGSLSSSLFFYDNSGNLIKKMTADKTMNYTYDYENRLIQYSDGANPVSFEYDGDGNRISKSVNGVKTKYVNHVLAPITQVLIEANAQYQVTNRYTYGYSRINQVNQSTSFYIYDNPGRSVTGLVNNSQSAVNSYGYDSFGNIKTKNETVGNSFKYVGEQFDEETGWIVKYEGRNIKYIC